MGKINSVGGFETTITFSKIAFSSRTRKINLVEANIAIEAHNRPAFTIDLEPIEKYLTFSATLDVWNGPHSDIVAGGQMFDDATLKAAMGDEPTFKHIAELHARWHLNGLKAGTRAQIAALEAAKPEGHVPDHYTWACGVLKNAGLYEIPYPEHVSATQVNEATGDAIAAPQPHYQYGHAWLVEPIPGPTLAAMFALVAPDKESKRQFADYLFAKGFAVEAGVVQGSIAA